MQSRQLITSGANQILHITERQFEKKRQKKDLEGWPGMTKQQ